MESSFKKKTSETASSMSLRIRKFQLVRLIPTCYINIYATSDYHVWGQGLSSKTPANAFWPSNIKHISILKLELNTKTTH
jgi:hypothetical protein